MKKKFDVTGMTCAACQAHVNDAVKNLKGVESCNVNLLQNTMDVSFNGNECSIKMIEDAVLKAGYQAKLQGEEKKALEEKANRDERNKRFNNRTGKKDAARPARRPHTNNNDKSSEGGK